MSTPFPKHASGRLKSYVEMTDEEREQACEALATFEIASLDDVRVQTAIIELYNGATVH